MVYTYSCCPWFDVILAVIYLKLGSLVGAFGYLVVHLEGEELPDLLRARARLSLFKTSNLLS